ncbi:MAG: GGDEF domain-containing protein [Planctomycetota bacterium]
MTTTPFTDRTTNPYSFLVREALAHITDATSVDEILRKMPPLLCDGCGFERAVLYMPDGHGLYRVRERHPIVPADAPESLPTSVLHGIGTASLSALSAPLDRSHPLCEAFARPHLIASFLPGEPYLGAAPLVIVDAAPDAASPLAQLEDLFATLVLVAALRAHELYLAQELERLREEVGRDFLTRLANRQMLMEMFEREMARAKRKNTPISLIMLDIDKFKKFNDTFGHLAGDQVLIDVAKLLSRGARKGDLCGRFGGEEFLLVLPETNVEHAYLVAERLRSAIERYGRRKRRRFPTLELTISIGVGPVNVQSDSIEQSIARVDAALYASKRHDGNRVCLGRVDEE